MIAQETAPPADSYLENLNPVQHDAVVTVDGPLLILAGAGTGKTRVLTTRLAHILMTQKAWPSQVLAVTFTNKAALEMKTRVSSAMGGQPVEGWWLGTFHALAARMLRQHAECVDLKSNFTILDDDDQARLIKQLCAEFNIDTKRWPPRTLLGAIQKWKDKGQAPEAVPAGSGGDMADGKLLQIYSAYQKRLATLNACDFGDLLLHMLTIFRDPKNAHILQDYQDRFKYILVDEYQDTNTAQYMWLRLMAQKHKNICCVGDDDQSIYGWRGAEIGNILKFEKDFEGAQIIRLEQNYRSTQNILAAANGVIANNTGRLGKELWSAAGDGEKVTVRGVWDAPQEARAVAEDIESLQRKSAPLSEIAILVRAAHQMREFEEKFTRESIPYKVIGGPRFYERQEIRDALAYLRVTIQPDDDLAFERIVNTPKRGLGKATLDIIRQHARTHGISMFAAVRQMADTLKPKPRDTLKNLIQDFDRWRGLVSSMPHPELAQLILDESGYIGMWQGDKSPEAPGRLENLKECVNGMAAFDDLLTFLEHVSLVMENTETAGTDTVSIMTLHAAKGLEFKHVFLPGWEEGLFPSQRSMDENGAEGLEEERRLAYVGITRAREKAVISFAANRMIYGSWTTCLPSRFVTELPKDHIDEIADTGIYGGAGAYQKATWQKQQPAAHRASLLESAGGFTQGDRVFHDKFGYGKVIATDGNKLDISFDKAGRKKVVEDFVTAAPLS